MKLGTLRWILPLVALSAGASAAQIAADAERSAQEAHASRQTADQVVLNRQKLRREKAGRKTEGKPAAAGMAVKERSVAAEQREAGEVAPEDIPSVEPQPIALRGVRG